MTLWYCLVLLRAILYPPSSEYDFKLGYFSTPIFKYFELTAIIRSFKDIISTYFEKLDIQESTFLFTIDAFQTQCFSQNIKPTTSWLRDRNPNFFVKIRQNIPTLDNWSFQTPDSFIANLSSPSNNAAKMNTKQKRFLC